MYLRDTRSAHALACTIARTPYRICVLGYATRGLRGDPQTARAWSEAPA